MSYHHNSPSIVFTANSFLPSNFEPWNARASYRLANALYAFALRACQHKPIDQTVLHGFRSLLEESAAAHAMAVQIMPKLLSTAHSSNSSSTADDNGLSENIGALIRATAHIPLDRQAVITEVPARRACMYRNVVDFVQRELMADDLPMGAQEARMLRTFFENLVTLSTSGKDARNTSTIPYVPVYQYPTNVAIPVNVHYPVPYVQPVQVPRAPAQPQLQPVFAPIPIRLATMASVAASIQRRGNLMTSTQPHTIISSPQYAPPTTIQNPPALPASPPKTSMVNVNSPERNQPPPSETTPIKAPRPTPTTTVSSTLKFSPNTPVFLPSSIAKTTAQPMDTPATSPGKENEPLKKLAVEVRAPVATSSQPLLVSPSAYDPFFNGEWQRREPVSRKK